MSVYSIKDLENLSGIKAHTLRIWEQRYNIVTPKRTDTNIRYYDDNDLKLILNISLLQEHGFKISKIAQMQPDIIHRQVLDLSEQDIRYTDQIQALTIAMIDLDEERFEKVLTRCALQMGFEQTMIQVIFPFLIRIGILWQTAAITPAQEHFISHLIRQKIIVAADGQITNYTNQQHKYMLFLPDGELHELSLLFANYLLKVRKQKVIYLGQSLPFQDIESVHAIHKPDYLFTIITSVPGPDELQPYITKLSQAFPNTTILITGYQAVTQSLDCPSNVLIMKKIQDFIEFIDNTSETL